MNIFFLQIETEINETDNKGENQSTPTITSNYEDSINNLLGEVNVNEDVLKVE